MTSVRPRPCIVLLGADGQVGRELRRSLLLLGNVVPIVRADCDLSQFDQLLPHLQALRPSIVVNAAAYTAVDQAEQAIGAAQALNADLPAHLAQAAGELGFKLVHYSTDYVFDGAATEPYREDAPCAPASVYGRTKLSGEQAVLGAADALVFRLSWVFGLHGGNFVRTMLKLARERDALRVVNDQFGCPTPAALVADVTVLALQAGLSGLYHLSSQEPTNWHAYAQAAISEATTLGLPGLRIRAADIAAIASSAYPTPAKRPAYSVFDCAKIEQALGIRLPSWRPYLHLFVRDLLES